MDEEKKRFRAPPPKKWWHIKLKMIVLENDSIIRHTPVNYISDAKGSEYSAVDWKVLWIKSYEMIYF